MSDIQYEKHSQVRLITINRAEKMNSLDFAANDELVDIWKEFDADETARVAVITGAGDRSFCAGADLKTYSLNFARTPAPEFRKKYTNGPGFGGITRNLDIDKPIVAAVNGFAISGGFELSLACDLRFCSPNAEFALQDAKWGFHACDGGLIRLPQIVGMGHAMEIILSGERIDAEHAYRIGLVNRIYPQAELLGKTMSYAQMLASRAPLSHRFAKEMIRTSMGMNMPDALKAESRSFRDFAMTADLEEGLSSFRERRDAVFTAS
ncbi:enoyl-CoA hydratase [Jezberella montanilacus]|jgi:enoyl-CoA hydratase/carnithine racemase|uniref:Enoyl-CoA hydratase n=1 Tax=Jezberella montanilacus TaxID=323426 RepID=A0A2T0XD72_9BURK|nr:enoyl-CoA hydratase-related protein [Jezberella montanilacus]PRY96876.1 enoyl-CoA hydratase [Jezberella montanilacus]